MKTLLTFLVLLFSSSVVAEDEEIFTIWGVSGLSCEELNDFLIKFEDKGQIAFTTSLQGYLSGYNSALIDNDIDNEVRVINNFSLDYMKAFVIERCKKNNNSKVRIFDILYDYFIQLPYRF